MSSPVSVFRGGSRLKADALPEFREGFRLRVEGVPELLEAP